MLAILWIGIVAIVGYVAGAASFASWTILITLALAPPLVIMRFWGEPAPSLSQSIQDELGKSDGALPRGAQR